jgi:methionyl-tRNA formyltransferase
MRIFFLGTPESAAFTIRTLLREGLEVVGVLTRPDAPKGRSLQLTPSPVKEAAVEAKLPVYQFEKASSPDSIEAIRARGPDVIVVVAYGQILSEEFLRIPKEAIVNVHYSLLPKYRGAAPVHWAIINGERETGVTVQHLAKKLDTGDIILQEKAPIAPNDTAGTLSERLKEVGARLLVEALRQLQAGTAPRIRQDESQASYARKLTKEDGEIDWRLSAAQIVNRVRGMNPWPGAYTFFQEKDHRKTFKVLLAGAIPEPAGEPGRVLVAKGRFVVAAGEGSVELLSVQPEGKRQMDAAEFLRGHPITEGTTVG